MDSHAEFLWQWLVHVKGTFLNSILQILVQKTSSLCMSCVTINSFLLFYMSELYGFNLSHRLEVVGIRPNICCFCDSYAQRIAFIF